MKSIYKKKSTNSSELHSLAHVTNTNLSSVVTTEVKSQFILLIYILEILNAYKRTIFLIYHLVTKSLLPK